MGKDLPKDTAVWLVDTLVEHLRQNDEMFDLLDEIRTRLYECAEGNIVRDWLKRCDDVLAKQKTLRGP
jgi:hypothetical protein